jgi:hypothetical protein
MVIFHISLFSLMLLIGEYRKLFSLPLPPSLQQFQVVIAVMRLSSTAASRLCIIFREGIVTEPHFVRYLLLTCASFLPKHHNQDEEYK